MPDSAQHAPALQRGRWYFGWNIVAVATVLVLLSIGLRLAVGPFFLPIVDDLGLSRSLFSSIVALALLVYGLVMPGVGWLVGRVGTRRVLLLGTALILAGGLWAATAHGTLTFTLAFSVVLSLGLALVSPVTLTKIVSTWFVRQRGMALFFLSTGGMA
ncbi:MAG: MFS transporter, partial [Ottowia sp.]|nr:MFS transporter [Ottowia sp.]